MIPDQTKNPVPQYYFETAKNWRILYAYPTVKYVRMKDNRLVVRRVLLVTAIAIMSDVFRTLCHGRLARIFTRGGRGSLFSAATHNQ